MHYLAEHAERLINSRGFGHSWWIIACELIDGKVHCFDNNDVIMNLLCYSQIQPNRQGSLFLSALNSCSIFSVIETLNQWVYVPRPAFRSVTWTYNVKIAWDLDDALLRFVDATDRRRVASLKQIRKTKQNKENKQARTPTNESKIKISNKS